MAVSFLECSETFGITWQVNLYAPYRPKFETSRSIFFSTGFQNTNNSDILLQDPVCGSAHCVLAPYWGGKLGKQKLTAFQVLSFCYLLVTSRE